MAALGYGFHQMSTERAVRAATASTAGSMPRASAGGSKAARASTADGSSHHALRGRCRLKRILAPDYGEDDPGGSGFALSYGERISTSARAEFGARFEHALDLGEATRLNLDARLAYAHDWIGDPALTASFQSLPGASFTVNGAAPPRNRARLSWR